MGFMIRLGILICSAGLVTPAIGCSICRCGDPAFNALGNEGVSQAGLRLALDWDQLEKTQGGESEKASLKEERMTLLAAFGFSDRFGVFARVPHSERNLTETEDGASERVQTSGLADPEIYGQARLWASEFEGDVGVRASTFAVFGVKTDWGENDASQDGERLDEHAQPGTGSTDWFGGVYGSYQLDRRSVFFASAQYRRTGRNDAGYRYGNVVLANLAYEHKVGLRWDAVVEANYRHADRDEVDRDGTLDPDTGGSIVYITPRLLFDAGSGWVSRVAAQIPLSQGGLYGSQHEKTVVNAGITHLFKQ